MRNLHTCMYLQLATQPGTILPPQSIIDQFLHNFIINKEWSFQILPLSRHIESMAGIYYHSSWKSRVLPKLVGLATIIPLHLSVSMAWVVIFIAAIFYVYLEWSIYCIHLITCTQTLVMASATVSEYRGDVIGLDYLGWLTERGRAQRSVTLGIAALKETGKQEIYSSSIDQSNTRLYETERKFRFESANRRLAHACRVNKGAYITVSSIIWSCLGLNTKKAAKEWK